VTGEYLSDQYKNDSNLDARIRLHDRFSTNKMGWHAWVFGRLDLPSRCRVLELGCGAGTLWLENVDRVPGGWDVTLSDFSLGMLQGARRNLRDVQRSFGFSVVDAQTIPFEDERFDAIIANHMLYHVPDLARAFSEIRRVLRPGGHLYASTVGWAHLRELRELISRFDPDVNLWGDSSAESFLLENGLGQISRWFSEVTLCRYEDGLVITEAEPLVAYVLSTRAKSALAGDRLAEFITFVEQELADHGVIYITKDSGVFEAS
jgi:SAM-dependent methyltransferase